MPNLMEFLKKFVSKDSPDDQRQVSAAERASRVVADASASGSASPDLDDWIHVDGPKERPSHLVAAEDQDWVVVDGPEDRVESRLAELKSRFDESERLKTEILNSSSAHALIAQHAPTLKKLADAAEKLKSEITQSGNQKHIDKAKEFSEEIKRNAYDVQKAEMAEAVRRRSALASDKTASEAEWKKKVKDLTPRLKAALQQGPAARAASLSRRFQEARTFAAREGYAAALAELNMVEKILLEKPVHAGPETDYNAEVSKYFETILDRFSQLEKVDNLRAEALKKELVKPMVCNEQQYEKAVAMLTLVEKEIAHSLKSAAWAKKVDIGTYQVGKVLGEGGQGVVKLLKSSKRDSPELAFKPCTLDNEPVIQREAAAYKQVGDHPNIARCLGVQTIGSEKGLVMEALSGGDMKYVQAGLRADFESNKIKTSEYWGAIQYTLAGMLQGLAHMEAAGMVHCDIKPDNIMYDADGEVKIVDMGGAVPKGEKNVASTPAYQDPNQWDGPVTEKTDPHAVGKTAKRAHPSREKIESIPTLYSSASAGQIQTNKAMIAAKSLFEDNEAKTEYGKFISLLTDPDPTKRLKAGEALEHPFIKDRLLADEDARKLIMARRP